MYSSVLYYQHPHRILYYSGLFLFATLLFSSPLACCAFLYFSFSLESNALISSCEPNGRLIFGRTFLTVPGPRIRAQVRESLDRSLSDKNALSEISQRDLRDKDSSLGKRPPSTRPVLESQSEKSGSFNTTGFASPAAGTAYSTIQDGYTTPSRSQGVMRSITPSQVSQSPIVHHVRASLPALLNGSPTRLSRSASFSNKPAQGTLVTIAAAQSPAHFGYASQTAFTPTRAQDFPAPLCHNQTTPAPLHHIQTTPGSLQYNHTIPASFYFNQTASAGYHNHYIPQGNPYTNSSAPFHSIDQKSTAWSSTPSSSQVTSSSLSSVPYQFESEMTEEVYDIVGNYLGNDSDPMRLKARKLIEEEDRTSCPEWRQLNLSVPFGSLPSVEDCNNLAPPLLKILAIVPIREVLHTRAHHTHRAVSFKVQEVQAACACQDPNSRI